MTVPTAITDLSATASSNSPAGGEAVFPDGYNYIRAAMAFIRQGDTKASDIASASIIDLGAAVGRIVDVTGTTTITSFGTVAAGIWRIVRFTGALTLTHHATSLILPTGASITTKAGDCLIAVSLGSWNWVVTHYQEKAAVCSFRASSSSAQESVTSTVTGWGVSHDTSGDFNATTGVFTVPYTGLYLFTFSAQASSTTTVTGNWSVGVYNASTGGYITNPTAIVGFTSGTASGGQRHISGSVVASLTAAQSIRFGIPTLDSGLKVANNAIFSCARLS